MMRYVIVMSAWRAVQVMRAKKLTEAKDIVETAFLGFHITGSWNLISVFVNDLTVSLKWLTVTLKIETG